jgi:tripartite-type tricarboxylate transporter receptor subunit TctC
MRLIKGATVALLALLAGLAPAAAKDDYPNRPITIVVPFAAGGPTDVLARVLAQHMGKTLGQQVLVENPGGAGGTIGSAQVARAAPNGYTMVMGNLGSHAASVGIYKNLAYDPVKDFEPVMLVGTTPMMVVVKKDLPVKTLKELVDYAKAHPGEVGYGTAGKGSIGHLAGISFNQQTGAGLSHIAYRGLSQAMTDVIAGQIEMMFDQVVSGAPHVRNGSVRALAVAAPKRVEILPDVPTSAEAGVPGFVTLAWSALFLPKDTPRPVVDKIVGALEAAFRDADIQKRMKELGNDVPPPEQRTPEALRAFVAAEIAKWAPLIEASGEQ